MRQLLLCAVVGLVGCGGKTATHPKNVMALRTFNATKPSGDHTFRIVGEISDNFAFTPFSSDDFYCVMLKDDTDMTWAYAPRNSPEGKALFKNLSDGRPHKITVVVYLVEGHKSDVIVSQVLD